MEPSIVLGFICLVSLAGIILTSVHLVRLFRTVQSEKQVGRFRVHYLRNGKDIELPPYLSVLKRHPAVLFVRWSEPEPGMPGFYRFCTWTQMTQKETKSKSIHMQRDEELIAYPKKGGAQ